MTKNYSPRTYDFVGYNASKCRVTLVNRKTRKTVRVPLPWYAISAASFEKSRGSHDKMKEIRRAIDIDADSDKENVDEDAESFNDGASYD